LNLAFIGASELENEGQLRPEILDALTPGIVEFDFKEMFGARLS
jgi:hypothetical protein